MHPLEPRGEERGGVQGRRRRPRSAAYLLIICFYRLLPKCLRSIVQMSEISHYTNRQHANVRDEQESESKDCNLMTFSNISEESFELALQQPYIYKAKASL